MQIKHTHPHTSGKKRVKRGRWDVDQSQHAQVPKGQYNGRRQSIQPEQTERLLPNQSIRNISVQSTGATRHLHFDSEQLTAFSFSARSFDNPETAFVLLHLWARLATSTFTGRQQRWNGSESYVGWSRHGFWFRAASNFHSATASAGYSASSPFMWLLERIRFAKWRVTEQFVTLVGSFIRKSRIFMTLWQAISHHGWRILN